MYFVFYFVLNVLIVIYIPRVYLIEVKVELASTFFFVFLFVLFFLTNFYFVIESEHAFFSVNKVVYQTRGRCDKLGYKIYWKCSINAFVSNLTILTFSKVMMWHLLGVFVNWATVWAGQAKQRIKPRGWGIQKWGDHVLVNNVHHHSFSW